MQPFTDNKGNMPFYHLSCWSLAVKDGWVWAGSANGLYKIDTRTRTVVKQSIDGRLDYGINDISPDGDSAFGSARREAV